jgi:hypothetical protein
MRSPQAGLEVDGCLTNEALCLDAQQGQPGGQTANKISKTVRPEGFSLARLGAQRGSFEIFFQRKF